MSQSTIYESLADHQQSESWELRDVMQELHVWAQRFIFEFRLEIPDVTIGVEFLRRQWDGQFREGHNGFGLRREIIIDRGHVEECLREDKWYDALGTLLHEELHGWQEEHGKSGKHNYHNRQFQRKAAEFGLIVSPQGHHEYAARGNSPFFSLLEKYGVRVPQLPEPVRRRKTPGRSKLKLWICGCQPKPVKVRVGRAHFRATCNDCGCDFVRVSPVDVATETSPLPSRRAGRGASVIDGRVC